MIASLRGTLVDCSSAGEVVVEVAGVGYRVVVAPATLQRLGRPGASVLLHTYLHVREDALTLYGFLSAPERRCFEALLGAHGVGPALAVAILSVHAPHELARVVAEGDVDALVLVPGVGRKTAARLLLELKARLDVPDLDGLPGHGDHPASARAEVRAALAALGYDGDEVRGVLSRLPANGAAVEDLLRSALQLLGAER